MKEFVKPEKTAVIVIDPQNDYCSSKGFFSKNLGVDVSPLQKAIPKIKEFVQNAKNKGLPIIYTKMTEHRDQLPENLRKKMELTHGSFFAKPGSWGHDFYEIQPSQEDVVLEKNQYDAFTNPELEKILREKDIENIIVAGFTTNVCVDTTVRSAFSKGFNVVLAEDLVATIKERENLHTTTLKILGVHFAYVVESEEIKNIWEETI